ncbi:hypothetical protein CCR94_20460 [Rhodoblastus sphagnicola]|uniref:histidine kinase n=1 Tax=Rhodoblastus sphagnicola TaxID=333368 RepID=A0A2S6MXY9_9HYPH|nr:ATP-binding protein [Rhodoblastus sphagnicola]MBB4196623.1 PAS domain S-box-containing protein [Rhodoblastus sphagnicola]PPQ27209.1 hypothetical protein CCR94_20460 [Rhodoblastus sphagnicola]
MNHSNLDSRPHAILVALVLVLVATLLRLTLLQSWGASFAFITFYPAVMLAVLHGGAASGLTATLASTAIADYFWLEPAGSLVVAAPNQWLALAVFVASNLLVVRVAGQKERACDQLRLLERARVEDFERRAEELERQVAKRTASLDKEISERRRAEADLWQATAILRGIGQHSPDPIYVKDVEGRFLYANPAVLAVIGKSAAEVLGSTDAELHSNDEQAAAVMANDRRIMRGGAAEVIEERWDGAGPRQRIFRSAKAPLLLDDGSLAGIVCVSSDITQSKAAEQELRMAKAEAERAVLARSKFLAAASHDLRQPVQSLVLLLAMLKQNAVAPKVVKAAELMGQALDGLTLLLNSILDMSRLDAGVVMPQVRSVDVGALLDRLSGEYAAQAEARALRFKGSGLQAWRATLHARTDPALLERALRNLIENALRYTRRGGVLVGVRRRGDRVRIDVVDTGVGIAAEKLSHIFEEFYQVSSAGRERANGLGLGLSIVERIAHLLGAEIEVRSREGRGSRFSLLLPLDDEPAGTAVPPDATGAETGRILVIDDDEAVRFGLRMLLEGWGYQTIAAASGDEALALGAAEAWRFDAIVADHRLGPGLTGVATVHEIQARAGRTFPTLVVTGDTAPERIAEIHASGFDLLHKPAGARELRLRMARLLAGAPRED